MPLLRPVVIVTLLSGFLAAAATSWKSCCSMTAEELNSMRGNSDDCPQSRNHYSVKSVNKCDPCPTGTCRVSGRCYCAGNFVKSYEGAESGGPWSLCEYSFGKSWPESVGSEDVTWRSCQDGVEAPDFKLKTCCQLTQEELLAASGTSNLCPTSRNHYDVKSISKCETCPPGKWCSPGLSSSSKASQFFPRLDAYLFSPAIFSLDRAVFCVLRRNLPCELKVLLSEEFPGWVLGNREQWDVDLLRL